MDQKIYCLIVPMWLTPTFCRVFMLLAEQWNNLKNIILIVLHNSPSFLWRAALGSGVVLNSGSMTIYAEYFVSIKSTVLPNFDFLGANGAGAWVSHSSPPLIHVPISD